MGTFWGFDPGPGWTLAACLRHASGTPHSFWTLSDTLIDVYHVYVLKSQKNKRIYFGYTSDLNKRIKEHNSGNNESTRYFSPWKLVYYESFLSKNDAIKREKQLKKYSSAYGFLKRRIKNSLDRAWKEWGVANGWVQDKYLPLGGEYLRESGANTA